MPYASVKDLPKSIKKYPAKIQRMWTAVFNSTYNKVLKETKSKTKAEGRAFKSANAIIKRNIEKFGSHRYGHAGFMQYMIDVFLDNLK